MAHASLGERVEEEMVVDGGALGVVLWEKIDKRHEQQQKHQQRMEAWSQFDGCLKQKAMSSSNKKNVALRLP